MLGTLHVPVGNAKISCLQKFVWGSEWPGLALHSELAYCSCQRSRVWDSRSGAVSVPVHGLVVENPERQPHQSWNTRWMVHQCCFFRPYRLLFFWGAQAVAGQSARSHHWPPVPPTTASSYEDSKGPPGEENESNPLLDLAHNYTIAPVLLSMLGEHGLLFISETCHFALLMPPNKRAFVMEQHGEDALVLPRNGVLSLERRGRSTAPGTFTTAVRHRRRGVEQTRILTSRFSACSSVGPEFDSTCALAGAFACATRLLARSVRFVVARSTRTELGPSLDFRLSRHQVSQIPHTRIGSPLTLQTNVPNGQSSTSGHVLPHFLTLSMQLGGNSLTLFQV